MATVPIGTDEEIIRQILTEEEIKSLTPQGLWIDTEFRTLWTKTVDGEMVRLGGGRKVDISNYPGLGEVLDTELPLQPNTIAGSPSTPVEVLNHLYARATSVVVPVLNPRILINNPTVDKVAETITFEVEFIDFRDIQTAFAYLSVTDESDADTILLGPVITQAEDDPDPAARTVTVPITEFSETRNRLYVAASTTREEEFFSNKLTLDVVELPPEPGVITVNTHEVDGGWVNLNLTFERLDHVEPVYLRFRGTGGYVRSGSLMDSTDDGTFDFSTPFDYDAEGTVEITVHATDLNGEPVVSAPFAYTFPEFDLQVSNESYDSATNMYTATVSGSKLEADGRLYIRVAHEDSHSDIVNTEVIYSGQSASISLPFYPGKARNAAVRFQVDDTDGNTRYLYSQILMDGPRKEPVIKLGEYSNFTGTRELRIEHDYDGQALRATLEVSTTKLGDYLPLDAGYTNFMVASANEVKAELNISPMRETVWLRPVVEMVDGVHRGAPVEMFIDSHEVYFSDGSLRLEAGKLVGHLDSNDLVAPENDIVLYASNSDATALEAFDLVYSGKISDLTDGSIDAALFTSEYTGIAYVYAVITSELGEYTTRLSRLIMDPASQPLPTVTITSVTVDSRTGDRIIQGTIVGEDRPEDMTMEVLDGSGDVVLTDSFIAEWDGTSFTGRVDAPPASGEVGRNGNFDIRLNGLATAGDRSRWYSVPWQHRYFNNPSMALTAVKFDLPRGSVFFFANTSGIDLKQPIEVVASDETNSSKLLLRTSNDLNFEFNRWFMDESLTGEITFTVTATSHDGIKVTDTIKHAAVLPHTVNEAALVTDPVEWNRYTHSAETFVLEDTYEDVVSKFESHWYLIGKDSFIEDADSPSWSVFDLINYDWGEYTAKRRLVTDDGKVRAVNIPVSYTDAFYRLVSVNAGDQGDMLVVPVINEALNESGIVVQPTNWEIARTGVEVFIDIPDNYDVESGEPGVSISTDYFERYDTHHLEATIDGELIYAKLDMPEFINTALIVAVQQAGRDVDVQWRIRSDITDDLLTGKAVILKVQDQKGAVTEFDVTPQGAMSYVNTASVTLPDSVIGTVNFILVIRTLPSTDLPVSVFKHTLNDKAYMSIIGTDFMTPDELVIQFESKDIVQSGQFAPKLTVTTVDIDNPTELVSNAAMPMEEGISSTLISGVSSVDLMLISIDYETTSGETRSFKQRVARSGLSDPFRAVTYDRDTDSSMVSVTGILAAERRSDIFSLQTRFTSTRPWSNRPFISTVDSAAAPERGFEVDFKRRDGFGIDTESAFGEYRLSAMTVEGRMFSDAVAISDGPAIMAYDFEVDPGDDLNPPIYKVDVMQRELDFTAPGMLKDSLGTTIDLASELARYSGNKPESMQLTFFDQLIQPPLTIRMHDSEGNRLMTTYPAGSTPLVLPETIVMKSLSYTVSDDELTLYLSPVVNLIGLDPATITVSIDGAEAVPLNGKYTNTSGDDWLIEHEVDDIGVTSMEVFVDDTAGNSYSLTVPVTEETPVDGNWGVIAPLSISDVELMQDVYGTTYQIKFNVTMDMSIASSQPTATVTFTDGVSQVDSVSISRDYSGDDKYKVELYADSFDFTTLTLNVTADNGVKRLAGDYSLTGSEPHAGKPVNFMMSEVVYIDDLTGEQDILSLQVDLASAQRTNTYLFINGSQVPSGDVDVVSNDGASLSLRAKLPASINGLVDISSAKVKTATSAEPNYFADVNLESGLTVYSMPIPDAAATELSMTDVTYAHRFEDNTQAATFNVVIGEAIDIDTVVVKLDGTERPLTAAPELVNAGTFEYKFNVSAQRLDLTTVSLELASTGGTKYFANHISDGTEAASTSITPTTITDVSFSQKTDGSELTLRGKINSVGVRNTKVNIIIDDLAVLEFVPLVSYDSNGFADFTFFLNDRAKPSNFRIVAQNADLDYFEGSYTVTGDEPTEITDAVTLGVNYVDFYEIEGAWNMFIGIDVTDIDTNASRINLDGAGYVAAASELYDGTMEVYIPVDDPDGHTTLDIEVTTTSGQTVSTTYTFTGAEGKYPETPIEPPASKSIGDFELLNPNIQGTNFAVIAKPFATDGEPDVYVTGENATQPFDATATDAGNGAALISGTIPAGINVSNLFSVTRLSGMDMQTATYFFGEIPTLPIPLGPVTLETTNEFTVSTSEVFFEGMYGLHMMLGNTTAAGNAADWSTATVKFNPSSPSAVPVANSFNAGTNSGVVIAMSDYQAGDTLTLTVTTDAGDESMQIGFGAGSLVPAKSAGAFEISDVSYANEGGQDYMNFSVSEDPSSYPFFGYALAGTDGTFSPVTETVTLTDGKWVSRVAITAAQVNMTHFAMMFAQDAGMPLQAVYVEAGIPDMPIPYGTQSITADGQMTIFAARSMMNVQDGSFVLSIAASSVDVDLTSVQFQTGPEGPQDALSVVDWEDGSFSIDIPLSAYPQGNKILIVATDNVGSDISTLVTFDVGGDSADAFTVSDLSIVMPDTQRFLVGSISASNFTIDPASVRVVTNFDEAPMEIDGGVIDNEDGTYSFGHPIPSDAVTSLTVLVADTDGNSYSVSPDVSSLGGPPPMPSLELTQLYFTGSSNPWTLHGTVKGNNVSILGSPMSIASFYTSDEFVAVDSKVDNAELGTVSFTHAVESDMSTANFTIKVDTEVGPVEVTGMPYDFAPES